VKLCEALVEHDTDCSVTGLPSTIDTLLAAARARIRRYEPAEALAATEDGAVLIDIRSTEARLRHGVVPGAVHIPRTVLEWRLDPTSMWRNEHVDARRALIVLCDHGYSSSLAAAGLLDLGLTGAGDVVGGFEAWAAAGLPTASARPTPAGLPGSGPPD
jgi:rhodanese-related sulfurtransferase